MLPPVELAVPYWQESADLVAEVAARFGAQVVVLRLLLTESLRPGGQVTYLAELGARPPNLELRPVPELLRERAQRPDPRRMPWATAGGPASSLAWARDALKAHGLGAFNAIQQRTWNLSSIWRLEFAAGGGTPVWLKQTPTFMKHESNVLRWLNRTAPGSAPALLAADDSGRSLLAHVAGDDLYGAPVAVRQLINEQLHVIQRVATEAVDELLALGVPDLRAERRAADTRRKLLAWSPDHPGLDALLQKLDQELERLEECGLPATLVHADNHPGNARGTARGVSLLDWGEAFVGNPVTDLLGMLGDLSPAQAAQLTAAWCASWRRLAPRSNPERALELAPFISALHGAATYAHFLQHIEQTEQPYHSNDVPRCLAAAAAL